jgi:hypothetical protein
VLRRVDECSTSPSLALTRFGSGSATRFDASVGKPLAFVEDRQDGSARVDADNDGMADAWESAHGLDPSNGNDHSTVLAGGYTAIESYINELADQLVP